jgi:pimeloyl-ACP methyl ester carboxylesterase
MKRRTFAAALAFVAPAALPGVALEAPFYAAPVDMALEPFASMADTVTLPDGRRLHLVCMGQGSPTVILTAGLGDWAGSAWERFQPEVAKITRVCSWDRPGFGLSDGRTDKPTVATNAADLEAALSAGSIPGPYVMVGHSLGAYETLLFTDHNRAKVAGMVLVDPSYLHMDRRSEALRAQFHLPDPVPPPSVAVWRQCAADVRSGVLKPGGPDPDKCVAFPSTFPRAVRNALTAQYAGSPLSFETSAAFQADAMAQSEWATNPSRDYGDLPLVVLTSAPPQGPAAPDPALAAASDALMTQAHDELAALSRRGRVVPVPGATHYVQRSQPRAVLHAIETVVGQARASKP